jgi:nicotinamidase-related amidase
METKNQKSGIGALLTPDNCSLLLIDYQPFQLAAIRSHDTQTVINNVTGLAKTAKAFGVPTLLSTVNDQRGGYLIKQIQDVFPDQKPVDRTWINAWEDDRISEWVKKTKRKKLVIAALWTEMCLSFVAVQAAGEEYDVYVVTDASGGVSVEAHEVAIQRMIQAGATPITWIVFMGELQRDWARTESLEDITAILTEYAGNIGSNLKWEFQLMDATSSNTKGGGF